ncbi:hypothetical protein [Photobacterium andalusiense]|uniref:Uncharacterized protein n=1 Tax=Photobacterium andalusiense TaxID=2204296 RepID=A0A1Y6MBT8_9GAMM|nr:hypothetical protein [Photobacterium andalusiense]SMY33218.1 hypothetical protein PAND9192_00824 [Photobacterium andalusiense]
MRFITIADTYLQQIIHWCLKKVATIFSILIALSFIALFFTEPFEYDDGLFDVDRFEIISIILFVILTWRFFKKATVYEFKTWYSIKRYSLILTLNTLISLAIMGGILIIKLDQTGTLTMSFLDEINDISLFFWFISIFITIYSFTPLPKTTITACHKKSNTQDKKSSIENINITTNEDN